MALCEPEKCVTPQMKDSIRSCLDPAVLSLWNSCTFEGTEECDASTTSIISICMSRKATASLSLPPFKDCHSSFLTSLVLNCLSVNIQSYMRDEGPETGTNQSTIKQHPHEVEHS